MVVDCFGLLWMIVGVYLLLFRQNDCLFLSVFKVIHLMLRAMSDAYFRKLKLKVFFFLALETFIFSFIILNFPLISSDYKRSKLQQKHCMTFC